jgi:uncharacterized protein (DUF1778 family)
MPKAQEQVVSSPGDVWIMGLHRLLCGDSTQIEAVEKVLAAGLANMVFTDPPYNVNYGATMKGKLRGKSDRKIANDNLGDGFEKFLYDACVNMLAVTKGAVYVCMSSPELHTLEKAFREAGGHWSTFDVWAENTFTMSRSDYQRQYKPILCGWKEVTDQFWCGTRDQKATWLTARGGMGVTYNVCTRSVMATARKERRINVRASETDVQTITRASTLTGVSVSTFIMMSATERAERTLADIKHFELGSKQWQALTAALDRPVRKLPRLRRLMQEPTILDRQ